MFRLDRTSWALLLLILSQSRTSLLFDYVECASNLRAKTVENLISNHDFFRINDYINRTC